MTKWLSSLYKQGYGWHPDKSDLASRAFVFSLETAFCGKLRKWSLRSFRDLSQKAVGNARIFFSARLMG